VCTADDVCSATGEHDGAMVSECVVDGSSAPSKVVCEPPPLRRRVDSGDDELVNVVAPLLHC
jgi:hypothetical protein